ncbi:MAG: aldo/keto reductase [bacterium]
MVDRRAFIKTLSGLTASAILQEQAFGGKIKEQEDRLGKIMTQRPLGDTGEGLTVLCLGGYHYAAAGEIEAQRTIEAALEGGIRFFDCAAEYQEGGSERFYGKFLTPKYRDISFLMTKSSQKTAEGVRKELEDSLRRMNTDYLDLWQIHAIDSPEDVENRLGNGVLDEFLKAKEEGKVRHIGFTGHRRPAAHLKMLEMTADTQPFSTCQMPMNLVDPHYSSFIEQVLPKLVERKISPLAMKTMSFGNFFGERGQKPIIPEVITVEQALHFVWSLPVTSIVSGNRDVEELQEKINAWKTFEELSEDDREKLLTKTADHAGTYMENYKA